MSAVTFTGDSGSSSEFRRAFDRTNRFRAGISVGILFLAGVAGGLAFLMIPSARDWAVSSLGIGWAPVGAFVAVTFFLSFSRPSLLVRRWRWWLVGAIAAAMAVIALSLAQGQSGVFYSYGLAGEWGYRITSGSPALAVVELLAALVLMSLLVIPGAARGYARGLRYAAIAACNALIFLGLVMRQLARWFAAAALIIKRGVGSLVGARRRDDADAVPAKPRKSQAPVADVADVADVAEPPASPRPDPAPMPKVSRSRGGWQLPPLETLAPPEPHRIDSSANTAMSEEIKDALAEHGVYVNVEDVKAGPRVIRFGLVPGYVPPRLDKNGEPAKQRPSRVRVGDIAKRQKDLALALKSPYIRIIETPEPGEGLVGLEVPNPSPGKVLMRSIIAEPEFSKIVQKGGLAFALGQDAGGQSLALDLAAMPHLLIAGATGSGKSVCINSLVASLLMTRPPDELRMIMVDPKRVELTPFNGIPHLVTPVIVEPDEVQPALRGLINEMTRRYKLMEETGVRNIAGYNAKAAEPMPFLVLIVDELADLMMTGGLEVEQQLVRLAQLGRAAGIHMVLATQRPSVKVVTGLLKANVPARVAFAVASQVDSRVILDGAGAEILMGKGDLLLLNNDFPKARRGQGTLVYDDEMDRLVDFWRNQIGPPLPPIDLDEPNDDAPFDSEDTDHPDDHYQGDILEQARDLALRNPRLTSPMLERRFKIRKSLADELIEELRGEGLVIGG